MIWYFVCSGNTCRSPMAAAVARARLAAAGRQDVAVFSAGLQAVEGEPATPEALAATAAAPEPLPGLAAHRAHRLEAADVFAAERIFTMTRQQAEALRARFPDQAGRIRALDPAVDVFDPFGRGREAYDEVLAQLGAAIAKEVARWVPLRIAVEADATGADLAESLAARLRVRTSTRLRGPGRHPGAFAAAMAAAKAVQAGEIDAADAVLPVGERPGADFALVLAQPAAAAYMAANRLAAVRAAWCRRVGEARLARAECDANLLCLSPHGRSVDGAAAIVEAFLHTACQGGAALAWVAEMRRVDAPGGERDRRGR